MTAARWNTIWEWPLTGAADVFLAIYAWQVLSDHHGPSEALGVSPAGACADGLWCTSPGRPSCWSSSRPWPLDAERTEPAATILTFGDALWWACSTITTVGYGDMSRAPPRRRRPPKVRTSIRA